MLKTRKKTLFLIAIGILGIIFIGSKMKNKSKEISVHDHLLHVEVVSQSSDMQRGLGGRKDLCKDCGMLFEFAQSGQYTFWMKDMLFPLDIIWINEGKIVFIEKNISPTFTGTIKPTQAANQVLEINAEKSDELGIEVGDDIKF